ncbi:hypothetical protein [Stigmatella erecta]|uniref:hypothetical protein n=1 Tax=Stigmatella erecta TaxID=83460 RepID=UPI000B837076|nr:hypothetical protein [Stigmatella erecta]
MSTERKSRIPSAEPPPWSVAGEKNIEKMIRLADEGNTDAGRRLAYLASRCLRGKQPLPETLRTWLATRLEAICDEPARAGELLRVAAGRGRQPDDADDMHARLQGEAFKDQVAWAVFRAVRAKEGPTKLNSNGTPTVFEIVSKWATQGGRSCSEREARRWYEERLPAMNAHQVKVDEILREDES